MTEVTTNNKGNVKRIIAWCLAICMCLTLVQVNVFASNDNDATAVYTATDANATATNAGKCKMTLAKTSYTYNKGKAIKPAVTVKNSKGKVVAKSNYTVSYKNNKKIGTATVTVKFKKSSQYSGTLKKTFKILPVNTKITKITAKKKGFTVKWAKKTSATRGYQIRYSTSKKFTAGKTKVKTILGYKNVSKSVTKLSSKKTYYVQIRTYKKVNGKNYFSTWSSTKTVKTK